MADEPIDLVREHVRLIREDLRKIQGDVMDSRDEMVGRRTVQVGPGNYMGASNERVELVGAHPGIAQ